MEAFEFSGNYALVTLPDLRQVVHTRMRLFPPFTLAWTGRRFTFQRRRLTLWAWLTLLPNCGPLPQISHTCAMTKTPDFIDSEEQKRASERWCKSKFYKKIHGFAN